MAKSIIDIPVNDESFQRFLETWTKYQDELKAQPTIWATMDETVAAMAGGFAAITAEIEAQGAATRKLADEEAKRDKAEREAAARKRKEDKEVADREKESARRRKQAIDEAKEFGSKIKDVAVDLAKWTLIGGGAGLAAGALSFWGLDRLVGGVGQERRLAQGFGVSTGERQALGVTMQRYFDVNGVLENLAEAQADPSKRWVFTGMGVNPQGKDPAQLATESALAARRVFNEGGGNELWAKAHGLLNIFSMDELRRLSRTPEQEIRGSIKDYNGLASLGLSDNMSRKWQDFIVKMDEAGLKLKNALIDRLTVLEPDLEKLIQKFTELSLTVLDRIDFKQLGDGLDAFTKYIGSGKFQTDFKLFIDNISRISQKIVDALRLMGVIPEANGTGGTGVSGGTADAAVAAETDLAGGALDAAAGGAILGGPAGAVAAIRRRIGGPIAAGQPDRRSPVFNGVSQNDRAAMKFYESQGWSKFAAAGIVAQLDLESGNNPNPRGPNDGGQAFGAAQWHPDRQRLFNTWAAANHLPDIRHASLQEQWVFVDWELKHHFKSLAAALQAARSAAEAGSKAVAYEGPKDAPVARRDRAVRAEVLIRNQTGASVATTVNAASR